MTTIVRNDNGVKLQRLGAALIRYTLVIVLLWVGSLKFTAYEAMGVHEYAINSPLLAWLANMMSIQSFSEVIGIIEIVLGILIAIKPYAPRASYFGSIGAIIMFLLTLTFVLTTPGVWQPDYGFPFPSPAGQFLLKDVVLLSAAVFTAGESLIAAEMINRRI